MVEMSCELIYYCTFWSCIRIRYVRVRSAVYSLCLCVVADHYKSHLSVQNGSIVCHLLYIESQEAVQQEIVQVWIHSLTWSI
jgi:hypothetical protein